MMKQRFNIRLTVLVSLSMVGAVAFAQSQVHDRAKDVLRSLGQEHTWDSDSQLKDSIPEVRMVESAKMTFKFYGDDMRFSTFRWTERLDEVRNRGKMTGRFYRTPQAAKTKAELIMRDLGGLGTDWKFKRIIDEDEQEFGNQVEFQSGLIGVEYEREVNGLRALGHTAFVTLDTMDGAVVSAVISGPDFAFEPPENLMTEERAVSIGQDYTRSYLEGRLGDESD